MDPATHVVMMEKYVARDLACVEQLQLVLDWPLDLIVTLEVALVNVQKQLILVVGRPILVLMVCVNVAQETLVVFQERLAFRVRVCADPLRHVRARYLVPIVIPQATFANALKL